jgi:hypothetical protein
MFLQRRERDGYDNFDLTRQLPRGSLTNDQGEEEADLWRQFQHVRLDAPQNVRFDNLVQFVYLFFVQFVLLIPDL